MPRLISKSINCKPVNLMVKVLLIERRIRRHLAMHPLIHKEIDQMSIILSILGNIRPVLLFKKLRCLCLL